MKRKAVKSAKPKRTDPAPVTPHASLAKHGKALLAALAKLGIHREFDLVLHLPLRYDDETTLYRISDAPAGAPALVEGVVTDNAIKFRPKRQLVCTVEDESGVLVMRFLNFYMSQVKQLAPGTRVRLFGEIRQGFFGAEMVHPRYRVVRGRYAGGENADARVSDHRGHEPGRAAAPDARRARRRATLATRCRPRCSAN